MAYDMDCLPMSSIRDEERSCLFCCLKTNLTKTAECGVPLFCLLLAGKLILY